MARSQRCPPRSRREARKRRPARCWRRARRERHKRAAAAGACGFCSRGGGGFLPCNACREGRLRPSPPPPAPRCSPLLLAAPAARNAEQRTQGAEESPRLEKRMPGGHLSQGAGVGEAERQLPCRSPAEAAGSLPLPAAFSHGEGCGFRLFPLQILNGTSGGRGNACRCLETAPRVTGPGAGGRPEGLLPETSDRGARGHPPARDTHPPSREHFPAWRRGSQMTGSPLSPGSRHSPGRGRAPARRQRVAGGSAECGRCGRQGRVQLHCGGPTPSCLPSGTHSCQESRDRGHHFFKVVQPSSQY